MLTTQERPYKLFHKNALLVNKIELPRQWLTIS